MLIKPDSCSKVASAAASTNATLARAGSGYLFQVLVTNVTASVKYLKIYNKASAPVVGTDVPFMTIALPVSNSPFGHPLCRWPISQPRHRLRNHRRGSR
jgi:hypothetical protein